MSEDEFLVFLACLVMALQGWYRWYTALINFKALNRKRPGIYLLQIVPWIAIGGIFYILKTLASFDVRDSGTYLGFYIIMGAAIIVIGKELLFYLFDISWRDDAIERSNQAAVFTISGAIIGIALFYAGANIGDGPGWWCVVFATALAAMAWFGLLAVIEKTCQISEKITIERDVPTGIRTGYYLIASGIICGRGAAGDWTSAYKTIVEFKDAWPVLILTFLAIYVQRRATSRDAEKTVITPALAVHLWGLFYILFAIAAVLYVPPLPQNPIYGLILPLIMGGR